MKRKLFIFVIFLVAPFIFASDIIIIVNKANDITSMSKNDIQKIYLGKKTTWDNGKTIKVAALRKGTIHDEFLKDFIKKAPSAFTLYWKKAVFTGTGTPPKFFDTESDLMKFISENPDAIGYTGIFQEIVKEITVN